MKFVLKIDETLVPVLKIKRIQHLNLMSPESYNFECAIMNVQLKNIG